MKMREISKKKILTKTTDNILPKVDIEPNFAKFDSETEIEKQNSYLNFRVHQRRKDVINHFLHPIFIIIKVLFCIVIFLFVLIGISGIPTSINKTYTASQFYIGSDINQEITSISIKGKLYTRWFSEPKFKGNIIIDNIDYTKSSTSEVIFLDFMEGSGWLTHHFNLEDGFPHIKSTALMWIDGKFDKVVLQLANPINDVNTNFSDLVLCAPAASREEGMNLLKEMNLLNLMEYTKNGKGGS